MAKPGRSVSIGRMVAHTSYHRRSAGMLLAFVVLCSITAAVAQTTDFHRSHRRSSALLKAERPAAMEAFLDSLRDRGRSDRTSAFAHRLFQARWFRHSGRTLEAYRMLDSLRTVPPNGDPYVTYLMNYQLANTLVELEVYDQAIHHAQLASLAAHQADMEYEAVDMELTTCDIKHVADQLPEAQACFEAALNKAQRTNDRASMARALLGMGNVYYYQENDTAALQLYNRALSVVREVDEPDLTLNILFNIGSALSFTADTDSAIHFYESVLDTLDQASPRFKADLLGNLASLYSDDGAHAKALELIDQAMVYHTAQRDTGSLARAQLFKATALWGLGKHEAAASQVRETMQRTRSMHLKAQAMRKLSRYLEQMGQKDEALAVLADYTDLADSLARSRYTNGIAAAQVRYETSEKERRIEEQAQALSIATAEGRRRSIQRNALIGATIALAMITLLLYRILRHRQRLARQQKEMHDQQVDQLLGQQELKSIHAMLEGQEKERERMAADLHDRLGSMLGGIKANMCALEERVEAMRQDQQFQKVNRLLDQTAGELRQISHDMAAATLSRFGLEKALNDLRDTIHISGRLAVELNTFGLEHRLERSVEITVYRIIQELVSNVLKHAKASELSIDVTRAPGRLSILVSDNGMGFDTTQNSDGMGLGNVRSRAATIGALMQMDSAPGKGTTVCVECAVVE